MLFLSESDVTELLSMPKAIELMRSAFGELAKGKALNQSRRRLILPTGAVLHALAGAYGNYFGTKIYSTSRQGAHFLFVLYRAEDGMPLALIEADHLGQIRTGAVTGLAVDLLAFPEADTAAVFGSGFQAKTQVEAILATRKLRSIRVWSRNALRRESFAAECAKDFGAPVQPASTAAQAVTGAQIVVTATSSKNPVLETEWIEPGTHISAVGSNNARRRELPGKLIRRAGLIVVDSVEQARIESGDLLLELAPDEWEHLGIVELKDVVAHPANFKPNRGKISIFKSNGLGLEDVAVASYVYEIASATRRGQQLPLFHS